MACRSCNSNPCSCDYQPIPHGISSMWLMPFRHFNEYTPVIPKFYYDVYSLEEREKHICRVLQKLMCYADYIGAMINLEHDERVSTDTLLQEEINKTNKRINDLDNSNKTLINLFTSSPANTWTIKQRVLRTRTRGGQASKVYKDGDNQLIWYQFFFFPDNTATLEIIDVETGERKGVVGTENQWTHGSMLDIYNDVLLVNNYSTVSLYSLENPLNPELLHVVSTDVFQKADYSTTFIFNGDKEVAAIHFRNGAYGEPFIIDFYSYDDFLLEKNNLLKTVTFETIPLSEGTSLTHQQFQIVDGYIYGVFSKPEQVAVWNIENGEFIFTRELPKTIGCAKLVEVEGITIIDKTLYITNNTLRNECCLGSERYYSAGVGYTVTGLFTLNLEKDQTANNATNPMISFDTEGAQEFYAYIDFENGSLVNPGGYDEKNDPRRTPFKTVEDALTFFENQTDNQNAEIRLEFLSDYPFAPRLIGKTIRFRVVDGVTLNYFYIQNCNISFYLPEKENWSFYEDLESTETLDFKDRLNIRFCQVALRRGGFPQSNNDRPYTCVAAYSTYFNFTESNDNISWYYSLNLQGS